MRRVFGAARQAHHEVRADDGGTAAGYDLGDDVARVVSHEPEQAHASARPTHLGHRVRGRRLPRGGHHRQHQEAAHHDPPRSARHRPPPAASAAGRPESGCDASGPDAHRIGCVGASNAANRRRIVPGRA